jgi:hypothetical protein
VRRAILLELVDPMLERAGDDRDAPLDLAGDDRDAALQLLARFDVTAFDAGGDRARRASRS